MTIKSSNISSNIVIIAIVVLAISAAVYSWYHNPLSLLKAQFSKAAPIPAAAKVSTTSLPVKNIIVYDKKAISKKLKLPDEIANDDKKQITATAQTPATDTTGKTDIVAVFDTEKNTTEIQTKQEPVSFFAFKNEKAIGIRYGFSATSKINYEADIYGRWDFLRTGAVHWGIYGEVNSLGEGKAMVSAEYRF
jgi:hypothetical protein